MEPILLRNCRLLVLDYESVVEGWSIYIEDGVVKCVGPNCRGSSGLVVDCSRSIVMPCTYNAHTHAAMTLLRGYYDDAELFNWLQKMWSVEKHLTPEIVYKAARLAVMEMLSHGVCGFMDMYYYPVEAARAAVELGARCRVGPVVVDADRVLDEYNHVKNLLEQFGGLAQPVINVHSLYTTPVEVVVEASKISREEKVPLHIHVSETRREVYLVRRKYGRLPVELLDSIGALHEYTVMVHAGWITSWELDYAARARASIVHCPTSNMKLATAGHFPAYEAMEKGVNVALGTDGPASNNTLDLFREMKMMVLLQRHSYWDTRIKAHHALRAATLGSARAMMMGSGAIREGLPADIVVLDAYSIELQPLRRDNTISAIVYAATGSMVQYTIVDGRIVYARSMAESWREEAVRLGADLNRFLESIEAMELDSRSTTDLKLPVQEKAAATS